jgi:hypothetical protein
MLFNVSSAGHGVNVTHSLVQGGLDDVYIWEDSNGILNWDNSNVDSDPLFVDGENKDYHLSDYSPAIGAGTATGAPTTDINGNLRPNPSGSNPDMGAYENALASQRPKAGTIADGLTTDVDWSNSCHLFLLTGRRLRIMMR